MRSLMGYLILMVSTASVMAQSSSMMRMPTMHGPGQGDGMSLAPTFGAVQPKDQVRMSTRAIEMSSMIAIPAVVPRKFKVEDLISIIVKQQKKYEADGKLDSEKKWRLNGQLSDWFRFYDDVKHLGSDNLTNGKPGFKFDYQNKIENDSENQREDKFTTRIQAKIIDVKPNGNLVLEAKLHQAHDDEEFTITLTGVCRSEDVTAGNSILSTQIAELVLMEENKGAVRDGTRRGWIPRVLDWARPF